LAGFNRREGEFYDCQNTEAELVGFLNCGDCSGAIVVMRLTQLELWNQTMEEKVTKITVARCNIDHYPHNDTLCGKVNAKAGVLAIEGTNPNKSGNIFA
jgi:predicted metal-binding protein